MAPHIWPIASLVQRGVESPLEAYRIEAVQQPRKRSKYGKIILAIAFSHRHELSWQLHAMHCTGTAFCFRAQHNTGFSFDPCPDLQLPTLHL